MSENISTGSRAEFLARIQQFTDEMLSSLIDRSQGKDVDEKGASASKLPSEIFQNLGKNSA